MAKEDTMMADNVKFLLRSFPNSKNILFDSSTHHLKNPEGIQEDYCQNQSGKTLGSLLKDSLGDDYYYIAYSSLSGHKYNIFNKNKPIPLNEPA